MNKRQLIREFKILLKYNKRIMRILDKRIKRMEKLENKGKLKWN